MAVERWEDLIEAAARRYNVDPRLVRAVMTQESRGRPESVSPAGARGLMQLMPATASRLGVRDPHDPAQAIDGGVRLLSQLLDKYGDPQMAILAYHGGEDQRQWGPRTRDYLNQVTRHYARLTGGAQPQAQGSAPIGTTGVSASSPAVDPAMRDFASGEAPDTPRRVVGDAPVETFLRGDQEGDPQRARGAPTRFGRFSEGVQRGVRDVLDAPAEVLAAAADRVGITEGLRGSALGRFIEGSLDVPIPTGPQAVETNRYERDQFNQTYGDSGYANVGRIVGQVASAAPILATGGNLLSAAGNAARIAAPGATAPLVPFAQTAFGTPGATAGGTLLNLAARGTGGAVQGAAMSGLTLDPTKPAGPQMATDAAISAGVNALVAPAIGAAYRGARDFFSPPLNPERARLAERAAQLDVPIYGPQITSSPFVRGVNNMLEVVPFSGQHGRLMRQGEDFTRAVSRTFGEDTPTITKATLNSAARRIGSVMDDVANRTNLVGDQQAFTQLQQLRQLVDNAPLETNQARAIGNYLDHLMTEIQPGAVIPGQRYQAWTRSTTPLAMFRDSDNATVREFGRGVRTILDDLLERSSPAGELDRLRNARAQWKAMETIRPLVVANPDGVLTPARLLNVVRTSYDTFGQGRGTGNSLGDLADIGRLFLDRVHGSDTARNLLISRVSGLAEGALPMALYTQDPMLGALGLAGSAAIAGASRVASEGLNSQSYRNRLLARARNGIPGPPTMGTNVPGGVLGVPAAVATGNAAEDPAAWEMPPVEVVAPRR